MRDEEEMGEWNSGGCVGKGDYIGAAGDLRSYKLKVWVTY